jgi:hypothetical protein
MTANAASSPCFARTAKTSVGLMKGAYNKNPPSPPEDKTTMSANDDTKHQVSLSLADNDILLLSPTPSTTTDADDELSRKQSATARRKRRRTLRRAATANSLVRKKDFGAWDAMSSNMRIVDPCVLAVSRVVCCRVHVQGCLSFADLFKLFVVP